MRYADPTLCPDCRLDLPAGARVCPACDLLVRHSLAVDLFATLRRADTLLAELRRASALHATATATGPVGAVGGASRPVGAAPLGGPLTAPGAPPEPKRATSVPAGAPLPPLPPPPPPGGAVAGSGPSLASVPKILLGTGAVCLLVAAVVFLAVSWSSLGVGGRTAVLSGTTLLAGGGALLLHRAGLRIAAESLVVVALGLLALDVVGAGAAGWLGDASGGAVACAAGLVTLVAALGLGLARVPGRAHLVAPQVVTGVALLVAYLGAMTTTDHHLLVGHGLTALGIAVAVVGRRHAPVLCSASAGTALVWLGTAAGALLLAADRPTLHELWVEGSGWSLLAAAAALLVPGLTARRRDLLLGGASGAAMIATATATLPSIDAGSVVLGLVALGTTAAWVGALAALPRTVRVVAVAPAALGSLILGGLAATTTAVVLERWERIAAAFARPLGVRLESPEPVTEPLLLVPSLLVVLAFVVLSVPGRGRRAGRLWAPVATVTAGLGLAATLASYDVPLALPVGVLALLALGTAALAAVAAGPTATLLTAVSASIAAAAGLAAMPSAALALAVAGPLAAALTAPAARARSTAARAVAGAVAVALLALATAAAVHVAGGGAAWVAVPVLLTAGLLALALPRVEVEATAVGIALVCLPVSLDAAADPSGLAALWLTVGGFLGCATALLHPSRRWCGPGGAALLLLASWIRLAGLEVHQPEAYTLPLALGLLALGLWRMRRSAAVGTAEALLPGLLLGTVPSLLWVLGDPVSTRALALGGACLALTLAGAVLRWSAPLLTGAAVGVAVVLRELGPYASEFPTWVWIGLAGTLLTVVGITWERRLLEVRAAVGLLGRLR